MSPTKLHLHTPIQAKESCESRVLLGSCHIIAKLTALETLVLLVVLFHALVCGCFATRRIRFVLPP